MHRQSVTLSALLEINRKYKLRLADRAAPCRAVSCHAAACRCRSAVLPDASSYRDVCVALRQEHDREVAISHQLMVRATAPDGLFCTAL